MRLSLRRRSERIDFMLRGHNISRVDFEFGKKKAVRRRKTTARRIKLKGYVDLLRSLIDAKLLESTDSVDTELLTLM